MSSVSIREVSKSFGEVTVLRDFTQEFADREFITLLGPSGCGKTTMLRMIAGFERPSSGVIAIDGKTVSDEHTFIPPEERGIGMVFQSYAVWPHMTVFDNVAYPLKIQKKPKEFIRQKTEEILAAVHLSQYAARVPDQLSGGQQQRVALGRALIAEPRLLLLDEPLSNLDAKLRESMRFEIKALQQKYGITVVYVTHDQTEAMAMSDRIIVMNGGDIQQVGTPIQIYRNPVNRFVADFVGKVNFLPGTAAEGKILLDAIGQSLPYTGEARGPVTVAIRPEQVRRDAAGPLTGHIAESYYLGDVHDCRVTLGELSLRMIEPSGAFDGTRVGDTVQLSAGDYIVFPQQNQ